MSEAITDASIADRLHFIRRHQPSVTSMTAGREESVLRELQRRRAHDLTEPQLANLRVMLRMAVLDQPIVCGPERIEILQAILAAHEGR